MKRQILTVDSINDEDDYENNNNDTELLKNSFDNGSSSKCSNNQIGYVNQGFDDPKGNQPKDILILF